MTRDASDDVQKINGVGPKTARILKAAGIRTVGDLARLGDVERSRLERGECIRGGRGGHQAAHAALGLALLLSWREPGSASAQGGAALSGGAVMADAIEKLGAAALEDLCDRRGFREPLQDIKYHDAEVWADMVQSVGGAALSTLTPGTRFTGVDGVELVVVPVEASEKMLNKMARVTYYQRAGGPTWENLKETGKALWRNRSKWAHAAMIAAASEGA